LPKKNPWRVAPGVVRFTADAVVPYAVPQDALLSKDDELRESDKITATRMMA
jgi:hypothetical protein